jgi:EmrB/QacA subfamily drug resistance transporter
MAEGVGNGSAGAHATRTLGILGLAALAFASAQTTLIPALPELGRALHTDASGVAWTLTGYLVSAAVFTPIVGRLGDMFGKRRLLVVALVAFALGCVVSAVSNELWIVVAGRVVQGVGGGIFPLCFGIIRDEFPPRRVAQSVGLLSAVLGIGGGAGLVLGGVIVDNISYHWIFWLGAIMAAAAAAGAQAFVPESPLRTPGRVDIRGAAVLGVGLVLPLVAISQAHDHGWTSLFTLGLVAVGLVVLALWVVLERRTAEPLADIATLARRPVLMTNLATLLIGFGMFGSFVLVPQLAEAPTSTGYGFGVDATRAGLLMLPGSISMLFLGPLSGVIGARLGNKVPLVIGSLLTAAGVVLLGLAHGTQLEVLAFALVLSSGIGLAFAAMPNLIIEAVPPEQTGEATGFNSVVRAIGTSLGTQVTATVLAGSVAAGASFPADSGFRDAFLVSAVVALAAAGVAALIPRAAVHRHAPVLEEIGASGPLAEPAYASEDFRPR